ncbi:MAG: STAS-like domain-containing protein [Paludibacteraceae bacterium]|nr:STAS-like domain-containing protein [Paludibacteraceae bacterium]
MVTFNFKDFGENLGTRPLGKRIREQLLPLLEQSQECVVLDFTGVNVVSNSFADECIAKLLLTMPLAELKSRTTFRGLNPVAADCVLTALQRRHITML